MFRGGNTTFKKSYAKLQQSSKGVLREFYEEAIYYLHQPSSTMFRFFICSAIVYWFAIQHLAYQRYFAATYKRKKVRLLELRAQHLPQIEREEHDILTEGFRNNFLR